MPGEATAVALAARAHPRGGAPSGDEDTVRRLRTAAAAVGKKHPDAMSGPSIMSPEGTLVLSLTSPGAILETMLLLSEELRPLSLTFCAALADRSGGRSGGGAAGSIESAVLAADSVTSTALSGVSDTDIRERRVRVLSPEAQPVLASLIALILVAYDGMTERQRQIVTLAKECDTQQEVARHLGVSRQAVNQSLGAAGWPHLRRAEEAARVRLSSMPRRAADGRS